MPSCVIESVAQISDAGISGRKTYTGNWPHIILSTLRLLRRPQGLSLEEVGSYLGARGDGTWIEGAQEEVIDSIEYLADLGLVIWTGSQCIPKKVRI